MRSRAGVGWAAMATALAALACGGESTDASPARAAGEPTELGEAQVAREASEMPQPVTAVLPPIAHGALDVASVVVAEPVSGERAALYLMVSNRGVRSDALVGLDSPVAESVGLHRTFSEGGLSRMRAADSLPVPARGEARMAPGGYHGMLEGLGARLSAGDTVALTLHFRVAGDVPARGIVVPYAALDALFATSEHTEHGGGR